uniref:Uncharacterized protein n=1 Tax=Noctiluca scintillans TaxID=2966 RepID=A0A7S1AV20_NOCSC
MLCTRGNANLLGQFSGTLFEPTGIRHIEQRTLMRARSCDSYRRIRAACVVGPSSALQARNVPRCAFVIKNTFLEMLPISQLEQEDTEASEYVEVTGAFAFQEVFASSSVSICVPSSHKDALPGSGPASPSISDKSTSTGTRGPASRPRIDGPSRECGHVDQTCVGRMSSVSSRCSDSSDSSDSTDADEPWISMSPLPGSLLAILHRQQVRTAPKVATRRSSNSCSSDSSSGSDSEGEY